MTRKWCTGELSKKGRKIPTQFHTLTGSELVIYFKKFKFLKICMHIYYNLC